MESTDNRREKDNQMISKTFALMEYLAQHGPSRQQDISASLGIPQTTLLRYLNGMIRNGYVYQDEYMMRYALTWKLCRLTGNIGNPSAAKSIVSPYVIQMSRLLNMGVAAMIAQGFEGIYLDLVDNPSTILTSMIRIGNCPPLNSTASGKILLSRYCDSEIEKYVNEHGLEKSTEYTVTDKDLLIREIQKAREQGFALENEECSIGVECVAVPIFDYNNDIYMALSVFDKAHITEPGILYEKILPLLIECAKEISERFGCQDRQWYDCLSEKIRAIS